MAAAGAAFSAIAALALAAAPLKSESSGVTGDPVKGRQVFERSVPQCSLCHTVRGRGGKLGPDLSRVGATRTEAWLTTFLPNPRSVAPESKMPPVAAKGKDLENLIAYLMTLKGK